MSALSSDAGRVAQLEKEAREKNAVVAKLRHDAVVTNEHLTEALRRLRKNQSDNNVDRRLVTNVLLSFLTTARADSKRFEMLSLLSTILSWDDEEREKAGLQRAPKGKGRRTSAVKEPEDDAMSEVSRERSPALTPVLLQLVCRVPPQRSVAGTRRRGVAVAQAHAAVTGPLLVA